MATTRKPSAAQIAARKKFAAMAKAGVFRKNPAKRKALSRPSQATGAPASKRLVKRRKATAKAPRGFYANPIDVNDLRPTGASSDRVTVGALRGRLKVLSDELSAPAWEISTARAIGALGIEKVSGVGYRLRQLVNASGGEQDLSPVLNAQGMMAFLDGAIMVARATK